MEFLYDKPRFLWCWNSAYNLQLQHLWESTSDFGSNGRDTCPYACPFLLFSGSPLLITWTSSLDKQKFSQRLSKSPCPLFPENSYLHPESVICQLLQLFLFYSLEFILLSGRPVHMSLCHDTCFRTPEMTPANCTKNSGIYFLTKIFYDKDPGKEGKRLGRREEGIQSTRLSLICSIKTSCRWPCLFLLHRCSPIIQCCSITLSQKGNAVTTRWKGINTPSILARKPGMFSCLMPTFIFMCCLWEKQTCVS